jgi:phosphatidylglycerophosphatase A
MRKLLITFFGAGLSPVAPGTVGSLAATGLLYFLLYFLHPVWWQWQIILVIGLVASCVISVAVGDWAVSYFGRKDPQAFVLDEVAGICLTNLLLPASIGWLGLLLAFIAFRIFDVTKPPPARQLEKLPAGWGILLDDLAAAVYANLLCQIVLRVWF